MSAVVMRVKCKSCEAHVPTTPADPARAAADGTPVNAATCAKCGATTLYRRPTPKPAEGRSPLADLDAQPTTPAKSQEVRLPLIVLQAAWWVKFTLTAFWFVVFLQIALIVFFGVLGWYLGYRNLSLAQ